MPMSDAASFGRRRYVAETPAGVPLKIDARERYIEPETVVESFTNPVSKLLNGVFLWLPKEEAPGFGAVCLAVIRQAVLPFAFKLVLLIAYMLVFNKMLLPSKAIAVGPYIQVTDMVLYIVACDILVQELSRYAFVRRANNPSRSIVIFGVVSIAWIIILHSNSIYTLGWMLIAQAASSFAMLAIRRYWTKRGLIVAAVVVCQTAFAVAMPQLGPHDAPPTAVAASAPTAAAVSPPATTSTVKPPPVGDMGVWAKLYPDATVLTNTTSDLIGFTDWQVVYDTHVSAAQIGGFYDGVASQFGFKPDPVILGVHNYTRNGSRDLLRYQTFQDDTGLHVLLTARTFGRK